MKFYFCYTLCLSLPGSAENLQDNLLEAESAAYLSA